MPVPDLRLWGTPLAFAARRRAIPRMPRRSGCRCGRCDAKPAPLAPRLCSPRAWPAARLTWGTVRPHRAMDPPPHRRTVTAVPTRETVYLLTRRSPDDAGPAALWALARHH